MAHTGSQSTKPVWHSPAWITAMVALVSVFFTVPELVAKHFAAEQALELAREKTKEAKINNSLAKQEQEYKIVSNTLAQQGTERIFVLRYLAATLDDSDARKWAEGEVQRLDELAGLQEELNLVRSSLERKEALLKASQKLLDSYETKSAFEDALASLEKEITVKAAKVSTLQDMAGLPITVNIHNRPTYLSSLDKTDYKVEFAWNGTGAPLVTLNGKSFEDTCMVFTVCNIAVLSKSDDHITVEGNIDAFKSLSAVEMLESHATLGMGSPFLPESISAIRTPISYNCIREDLKIKCTKQ